jgi:hypothetical protein
MVWVRKKEGPEHNHRLDSGILSHLFVKGSSRLIGSLLRFTVVYDTYEYVQYADHASESEPALNLTRTWAVWLLGPLCHELLLCFSHERPMLLNERS